MGEGFFPFNRTFHFLCHSPIKSNKGRFHYGIPPCSNTAVNGLTWEIITLSRQLLALPPASGQSRDRSRLLLRRLRASHRFQAPGSS